MDTILLNSVCVVLFILTGLSFVPQLVNFWRGKGIHDLSFVYVFFNLFSAIERFFLIFFPVVLYGHDEFVGRPLRQTDWLNFAQVSLVLAIFLVAFLFSLVTSPACGIKVTALFILIIQVLTTFPPAVYLHLECRKINDVCPPGELAESLLYGWHTFFVSPVATVLVGMSFFFQIGSARGLSSLGLLSQAVAFGFLALIWPFRMDYGSDRSGIEWYMAKGWAMVGSAVFSCVQLALFLATRGRQDEETRSEEGPLLYEDYGVGRDVRE